MDIIFYLEASNIALFLKLVKIVEHLLLRLQLDVLNVMLNFKDGLLGLNEKN
jgi:hypothetical protein